MEALAVGVGLLVVGALLALQRRRALRPTWGDLQVISRRQLARDAWVAVVRVDDGSGPRALVLAGGVGAPRLLTELEPAAPTLSVPQLVVVPDNSTDLADVA
jgi:hypothetical protein